MKPDVARNINSICLYEFFSILFYFYSKLMVFLGNAYIKINFVIIQSKIGKIGMI